MADILLRDAKGEPVVYPGVTCIKLKNKDGGSTAFYTRKDSYVVGEPVNITIPVTGWVGSKYTLTTSDYGPIDKLQIGIPVESSIDNAQSIVACALTIPRVTNSYTDNDGDDVLETYTSSTIEISAKEPPTKDITVCIWGLNNE